MEAQNIQTVNIYNYYKQCSKCYEDKKLDDFSFRTDINTYRGVCKVCKKEQQRAALQNQILLNTFIDEDNTYKNCCKCFMMKPLKEFQFRKDVNNYRSECKQCRDDYKQYRENQEEGKSEYNEQYRENQEGRLIEKHIVFFYS